MKMNSLALATLLAMSASASQAEVLIDNFNDPFTAPGQYVITDGTPATNTSTLTGLTGVLGGSRELSITCNSGCVDGSFTDFAALSVDTGLLKWVNGTTTVSTASVMWNANGSGLGVNLLDMGSTIVATVLKADLGFNYTLTLFTDDSNFTSLITGTVTSVDVATESNYALDWFLLPEVAGSPDYFIDGLPFDIDHTGTGVVLTNVNKILFTMTNFGTCYVSGKACATSVDLRIDDAKVVPEPGTLALLGLGLLGLGVTARRKLAA